MRGLKKDMKKDSYMGDVKIIKKIDDIPELKEQLIDIFESKSHKDISRYSLLLAEHILSLTNTPIDEFFSANSNDIIWLIKMSIKIL